jgi:myo-inositol-1(or 4)-monophosphatase
MDARLGCLSHPSDYLPIAMGAMDLAKEIVLGRSPGVVTAKGDRDMVSDVDVQIERAVRRYLRERSPEVGFLGEEEGNVPGDGELQWVLDPVDGTANFLKGIPLYSISLALVNDAEPVLGVIDVPGEGRRYSAAAGSGAYCDGTRVRVRPTARLEDAIVTIGDYAVGEHAEARNQIRLAVTRRLAERALRVRMVGSAAIDLAWLAHGRTDAAIMFANKPWDTAAGVILAREARGLVVDADGDHHTLHSASTVAASAKLLEEVLELISAAAQTTDHSRTNATRDGVIGPN